MKKIVNSHKKKTRQEKGYSCGPQALEALAGVYEIPLCSAVKSQALLFTNGAGVQDRCAVFQAALAVIGIWYGRSGPKESREQARWAARLLAERMKGACGSYLCREIAGRDRQCGRKTFEELLETAKTILNEIRKQEFEMEERVKKFKVHERMRPYVTWIMKEEDWRFVDAAKDSGELPEGTFTQTELEQAYRKGIVNKKAENGKIHYILGTFHKRIDCFMRGEREAFEALPEEVRSAIVEYEQDIHLWVIPYREPGKNKKVVQPVPIEEALQIVDEADCRFYVQECDCKVYRRDQSHMKETCLHFFTDESVLNTNFDRGYGRELTKEETKELLKEIDRDGLVHNFEGDSFCNCCSCCCWALRGMKTYAEQGFPVFEEYVDAKYIMEVKEQDCRGCGACVSICPAQALEKKGAKMWVDQTKCLGCGVCRTKCKFDALVLRKRGE